MGIDMSARLTLDYFYAHSDAVLMRLSTTPAEMFPLSAAADAAGQLAQFEFRCIVHF
jgi:hypothetical protein